MQYNLLNYGNAANPPGYKNARLSTIVHHVDPDVLGVNEVFSQPRLLDSILQVLGPGWEHSTYSNCGGQAQTNALFYRTSLFTLRGQTVIDSSLRDIIAYHLHYRNGTAHPFDSADLTVIVCHLKASNTAADAAERAEEAEKISAYLGSLGEGAYIVMGDLNVYTSAEVAYQTLINPSLPAARLYDPLARPGAWSGSAAFAGLHTQSPRTSYSLGDGGATGGLDDRFDQILVSGPVLEGRAGVGYLPGTYTTVGQDGLHFNDSLTALPANVAAPQAVVQALYEESDHLPVAADFVVGRALAIATGAGAVALSASSTRVVNPVGDWLEVAPGAAFRHSPVTLTLYSSLGTAVLRMLEGEPGSAIIRRYIGSEVPPGVYLLVITNASGAREAARVVKK